MQKDNAKPGDVVELKDKTGGFTDPATGFDISRDQKLELTDPIGSRTHEAIVSGGLLLVKGGKAEAKAAAEAEEQATADAAETAAAPPRVAVIDDSGKSKSKSTSSKK
jgi:hypothetical protein